MREQFDSDIHQNRRLSSHSYSHESVIFFVFFGLIFVKLRRVCIFEFKCMRLRSAAIENKHCGSVHYNYYDTAQQVAHMQLPQLLGCGTRSPLYLIGDAASRRGLSRVGYFIPLNGLLKGKCMSFYSAVSSPLDR